MVTRCVQAGRTTFTDGPCPPGAQQSEVRVRRNQNLADGFRPPPAAAAPARAVPPPQASAAPAAPALDPRAECATLARQIEQWDALARRPQSGQSQDWITARRNEARTRQFSLRC